MVDELHEIQASLKPCPSLGTKTQETWCVFPWPLGFSTCICFQWCLPNGEQSLLVFSSVKSPILGKKRIPSLTLLEQMNLDITIKMSTLILFFGWKKIKENSIAYSPIFSSPRLGRLCLWNTFLFSLSCINNICTWFPRTRPSCIVPYLITYLEELRGSKESHEPLPKWVECTFC